MLNILTAATPRPELHNETVIKTVQELVNRVDKINWYINIDCPKKFFTKEDRKATADNFLSLQAPNLKTIMLSKHSTAHFGRAARRLYHSCKPESDDDVFMWLEDDWIFQPDDNFSDLINHFFKSDQHFFLCSKHEYVTGNPFFFRREFFDHIVNKLYVIEGNPDPEIFLWECIEEKYKINRRDLPLNSIHKTYFIDAGRTWKSKRNITKRNKAVTKFAKTTWGHKKNKV